MLSLYIYRQNVTEYAQALFLYLQLKHSKNLDVNVSADVNTSYHLA